MQTVWFNAVMAKEQSKKKVGLLLPTVVADWLDVMTETVSGKEKWLIATAAMVHFAHLDEARRNDAIGRVKMAELPGGSFDELLPAIRSFRIKSSGHGRVKGERDPAKPPRLREQSPASDM